MPVHGQPISEETAMTKTESTNLHIAIIDDDAQDRRIIRQNMDRSLQSVNLPPADYHEFDSGESFLKHFRKDLYDLLFIDIYMKALTGIETGIGIRDIDPEVRIVFITTSNEFAAESYKVRADYYLLKPLTYKNFREMLLAIHLFANPESPESFLTLPDESRVAYNDIIYTDYHNHYVYFHRKSSTEECKAYMSQSRIEELLCKFSNFVSCSRGIIVNFDYVTKFTDTMLYLKGGNTVPVSRRRLAEVKKAYSDFIFDSVMSL